MGSWQEKINRVNQGIEAEKLRLEGEARRQALDQEDQIKKLHVEEEAEIERRLAILRRFKVSELLEGVRDGVWGKVGNVGLGTDENGNARKSAVILSFEYRKADRESFARGGGEAGGYLDTRATGRTIAKTTAIIVWLEKDDREMGEGYCLNVRDSELGRYGLKPILGADTYPEFNHKFNISNPNAQEIIEELLLRSCIFRQQHKLLPLQIKERAEREIAGINESRKKSGLFNRIIKGK
ncbi:MAG: hypothetical protein Q8P26_03590 [Candidatus Levybacteria bacterium]|nr:hypothetical protein [Candidatus Levybacteria bacterium]